mmetsp:Transcript_4394/g.12850  ORF Transcript_4394/g.12850 Transcript_4394/m.12850 type:complete len:212 (-) Transcript_4394:405-1040(-)
MLLQLMPGTDNARAIMSTASVGMSKSDVPLSMIAPQPFPQPMGSSSWVSLIRRTLLMFTVQVCLPITGMCLKRAGCSRWLGSFQTKKPAEPGFLPKHTEKVEMLRACTMRNVLLISTESSRFFLMRSPCEAAGRNPCSRSPVMKSTDRFSCVQASAAGVSGGPTPMIDWNLALWSTGMKALYASQKLRLTALNGPIDTRSKASVVCNMPLP